MTLALLSSVTRFSQKSKIPPFHNYFPFCMSRRFLKVHIFKNKCTLRTGYLSKSIILTLSGIFSDKIQLWFSDFLEFSRHLVEWRKVMDWGYIQLLVKTCHPPTAFMMPHQNLFSAPFVRRKTFAPFVHKLSATGKSLDPKYFTEMRYQP